jgi:hypothetical protein
MFPQTDDKPRLGRKVLGGLLTIAGLGLLLMVGTSAFAGNSGNTTANAVVNSSITLSGLTPSFTLTGDANSTVTQNSAVTMNVFTNNLTGYNVTVQAAAATMTASAPGNTDSIPVTKLKVRETGGLLFIPLSDLAPRVVHTQITRSGSSGDTINNDYQIDIPFVNADTYSVTLNYLASTI